MVDTTNDVMKVKASTGFVNAGSSVNGTQGARIILSALHRAVTQVQPQSSQPYDAGFVDVYLNGIKLQPADFTATNGTSVELLSAAQTSDTVSIVAYGTLLFRLFRLITSDVFPSAGVTGSS